MGELTRPERLQIMLTDEELAAIDEWRFNRRLPTRAAAVRELLRRGLAAEGKVLVGPRRTSRSYGVTDSKPRRARDAGE